MTIKDQKKRLAESLFPALAVSLLLLAACGEAQQGGHSGHQANAVQAHIQHAGQPGDAVKQQMQRLQLLIVQAINIASQSDAASIGRAAGLLRRAMSGPEMSGMHHDSMQHDGMKPDAMMPDAMMKLTHDLGDAAFDLLDATPQGETDAQWRSRLLKSASAASMRLEGTLLGTSIGEFEAEQGRQLAEDLLRESTASPLSVGSEYAKAAARLIPALNML